MAKIVTNNQLDYELGKIAYEAYCRATNWKSLATGDDLPTYEALRDDIRLAWQNAARAVGNFMLTDEAERAVYGDHSDV